MVTLDTKPNIDAALGSSNNDIIPFEPANHCPMCHESGPVVIERAQDTIVHLPGEFRYRACSSCSTVWMDPKPTLAAIPRLYPLNYPTHVPAHREHSTGQPRFTREVRDVIARRCFAYEPAYQPRVFARLFAALLSQVGYFRRHAGYSVRFLPAKSGGRMLDIGCGNGNLLTEMQKRGWHVSGIEPDPVAADCARKSGFRVEVATAESAELGSEQYDAIIMTDVLEHVYNPRSVLDKCFAALTHGGRLVTVTPNALSVYARWFHRWWSELHAPQHLVFPSPMSLRRRLSELGGMAEIFSFSRCGKAVLHQSSNLRQFDFANRYGDRSRIKVTSLRLWASLIELMRPYAGADLVSITIKP
jgi:2-polyprenyl-3-methyl-5-hydroxy-6-metoxy-1,4-benzoquinol methylase